MYSLKMKKNQIKSGYKVSQWVHYKRSLLYNWLALCDNDPITTLIILNSPGRNQIKCKFWKENKIYSFRLNSLIRKNIKQKILQFSVFILQETKDWYWVGTLILLFFSIVRINNPTKHGGWASPFKHPSLKFLTSIL
jgi:hypothetical protein